MVFNAGCAHIHHPTSGSTYMLFAGWEVRMVKSQGHMGLLKRTDLKPAYGPTLSQQITCLFFPADLFMQLLSFNGLARHLPTISQKFW